MQSWWDENSHPELLLLSQLTPGGNIQVPIPLFSPNLGLVPGSMFPSQFFHTNLELVLVTCSHSSPQIWDWFLVSQGQPWSIPRCSFFPGKGKGEGAALPEGGLNEELNAINSVEQMRNKELEFGKQGEVFWSGHPLDTENLGRLKALGANFCRALRMKPSGDFWGVGYSRGV